MEKFTASERLFGIYQGGFKGRWLDCGCGDGKTCAFIESKGAQAYGVDLDPRLPSEAILKADMKSLPFENGFFDAIIFECSLSVSGGIKKALSEAYRTLKPGGEALISDVYSAKGAETLPSLSGWISLIEGSGFVIKRLKGDSSSWRAYVAKALWDDTGEACYFSDKWKNCGKTGYFLLTAIKKM